MGYLRDTFLRNAMRNLDLDFLFENRFNSDFVSIFHLRFPFIFILICDVKRGFNASNVNYCINFNIWLDFRL